MVKEVRGVRWFTAARHVPSLIGRMHDGTMIKGGPYTLVQAFVIPLTAAVAWGTRGLWGTGSWIIDGGLSLFAAAGLGWAAGHMPDDRNPLLWVAGLLSASTQPRWGRANGRRITVPKPQRIHGHVIVQCRDHRQPQPAGRRKARAVPAPAVQDAPPAIGITEPAPSPVPGWAPTAVRHTGVEALLASINQGEQR
jgi:hypothetical protein